MRPLWHYDTQLERQAYAASETMEQRAHLFEQAHTEKRTCYLVARIPPS